MNPTTPAAPPSEPPVTPLIIDGHLDLAYNAVMLGRDLRSDLATLRANDPAHSEAGIATVTLPALVRGGVRLVFGTLFTLPATAMAIDNVALPVHRVYDTPDVAHQQAQQQLDYYRRLADAGTITLVHDQTTLTQVLASPGSADQPPLGVVVLMENADAIRTPDEVAWWYEQGLRVVGVAWQANRYAGGTYQPGPLTADGRQLLAAMDEVGMVLDTSHLAEASFWQAVEQYAGSIIASHSNCRRYAPDHNADRHLSDRMLAALIERDGVVGIALYNAFLNRGYYRGQPRAATTTEHVVRHIDHICQLAGSAAYVAIGSDLDGGFGRDVIPADLDSVTDLLRIAAALREFGYEEPAITAILGGNWQRILQRSLP